MEYKKISKFSAIILLMLLIFSFSVSAQKNINNMNFKNADTIDVLRAVAEVADVNLITDSQIAGSITVNLKDITFKKALDLITKTRGLDYKWDENTVVVASTERLDSIYNNIVTEYIKFNSSDFDNIGIIVKEIFPETQITIDPARRQFIIKGEKEKTAEIKEMINRLDTAQKREENIQADSYQGQENEIKIYNENYRVVNADIKDLQSKLRAINPNVNIKINSLTNIITLTGQKSEVKEALTMAKTYDKSLEAETRNIRVDYVDTEQISEIVGNFYPDIKLHVNKKRKEIIINGAKNKLDNVADLIKEINKPQYQVVIETRVEEIASSKLRELGIEGELSAIHFIKDKPDPIIDDGNDDNNKNSYQAQEYGQIDKLELTWPDFFNAIEENSDSTTLAQPTLMTLNGEKATMSILDERPYELKTENDNENSEITWEYAEAGVILDFTPWITQNNEIELQISPEVSSFTSTTTDQGAPPAKKSRKIETKLRLKDGETFAIGGLIQTDETGVITKIPLLGDIPLLGEIFKTRSNDGRQSELIIFVTPHIIKYGDEINKKNIINPETEDLAGDIQKEIKLEETKNENETKQLKKSKEEIINEYLAERQKEREEILKSIKKDKDKKEKYQDLSLEELEAILEK